jgi:hypothetical protein
MSGPDYGDRVAALLRLVVAWVGKLLRISTESDDSGVTIIDVDQLNRPLRTEDVGPGVVLVSSIHSQPQHIPADFVEHLRELGASERVLRTARSLVDE